MTLLFIKPRSEDGSGVLIRGEMVGCRKNPVPSAGAAGCFIPWCIQHKQKPGVFQHTILMYLK